MRQSSGSKQRKSRSKTRSRSDSGNVLEAFQVFDRMLIEFSMGVYNLPRRERLILRRHNERVHRAVRQRHLHERVAAIPRSDKEQRETAVQYPAHPRRQRRSMLSHKPEVGSSWPALRVR